MNKVLPLGARVVITNVDTYGYNGRELHPEEEDVGFHGVVIANFVAWYNSNDCLYFSQENATPGTFLDTDNMDGYGDVMYTVIAPDGRKLEVTTYEIEVLPSLVSAAA